MKPTILFVDDEKQILDGYRVSLRKQRKQWDMMFANSGDEALGILESKPVDVLVSDMRMPGMDGASLLNTVRKNWPQTIRMILSGYSEEEMILRVVKSAQHFLAKPCSSKELMAAIKRVLQLQDILTNDTIRRLVGGVYSLPSPPATYMSIVDELAKEEPSTDKLGEIVERDPGVASMILKVVNSPFFGFFDKVNSPARAIALLGINTLKGLVLSASLVEECTGMTCEGTIGRLTAHSNNVGLLTRCIATQENCGDAIIEEAFLAGLLHDIGKVLFMRILEQEYSEMIASLDEAPIKIFEKEKEQFGVTHAELGAYLLGVWGISSTVVQVTHAHHSLKSNTENASPLHFYVHVADVLEQEIFGNPLAGIPMDLNISALSEIGLLDKIPTWKKHCLGETYGK